MKYIFLTIFSFLFLLNAYANELKIDEKISSILPEGAKIESIEKSKFPGIYKVFYGDVQPLYVSENGNYFIYGDMFSIEFDNITNLTNIDITSKRKEILDSLNPNNLISFPSDNEIFKVTIFTDVECGYCRKLHNEIEKYNSLGITVNYAAFPRSGLGTSAFTKMVGAWCSKNPQQVLTSLKQGNDLNLDFCDTQPVSKHYAIGKKIGITGTPAIISTTGQLYPGYVPADELIKLLKS